MPRKIRELAKDLLQAGFVASSGKGSHRKFTHHKSAKFVVLSGADGSDAKAYQEKLVRIAIKESQR